MSTSYTGDDRPLNINTTSDVDLTAVESSSFAPVPAWERSKKRRKGAVQGAAVAAPVVAPVITPAVEARPIMHDQFVEPTRSPDPLAEPFVVTTRPTLTSPGMTSTAIDEAPVTYERRVVKRDNSMPLMVGAGVLTLATLGAAGWYATQPRDEGVAELTPGGEAVAAAPMSSETTTLATAPTAAPPTQRIPAATSSSRNVTVTRTAAVRRARPAAVAASPSAAQAGIDASGTATLPDAPQAYSGSAAAPAPAPAVEAPAPIPVTPPVASEAAPTTATPEPAPASPEVIN